MVFPQITIHFYSPIQHQDKVEDSSKCNYSKPNWNEMNWFLYFYNFDQRLNSIWDQLKETIYIAQRCYIPTIPVRTINQPKWFTPSNRLKIKCLRTLRKRSAAQNLVQVGIHNLIWLVPLSVGAQVLYYQFLFKLLS